MNLVETVLQILNIDVFSGLDICGTILSHEAE